MLQFNVPNVSGVGRCFGANGLVISLVMVVVHAGKAQRWGRVGNIFMNHELWYIYIYIQVFVTT